MCSEIRELKELWKEAFGDSDAFLDVFFTKVYSKDRTRIQRTDGKISSALYFFNCEFNGKKIAYLYAIATKKEFRNRGLCNALMKDTHTHLKELGYAGAILCPASDSLFGFYEKMGYKTCAYIDEEEAYAEKGDIILNKISGEEYMRLRRDFLPLNGVIQENENLDFLNTETEFFKADEAMFTSRRSNNGLFVSEFWGNKSLFNKIVYLMDCKKGIFRSMGNKKPFAMYLPFHSSDTDYPDYLGFAFD